MKITLRITVEIDEQQWTDAYGVKGASAIRSDYKTYVKDALYSMPVEPTHVEVR